MRKFFTLFLAFSIGFSGLNYARASLNIKEAPTATEKPVCFGQSVMIDETTLNKEDFKWFNQKKDETVLYTVAQTSYNHNTARSNMANTTPKSLAKTLTLKILDIDGKPLSGAKASCGNSSAVSDNQGIAKINIEEANEAKILVQKKGYFNINKNLSLASMNLEQPYELTMLKIEREYTLDGDKGGKITLDNGLIFEFKPGFAKKRGKITFQVSETKNKIPTKISTKEILLRSGSKTSKVTNVKKFFAINIVCTDGKSVNISNSMMAITGPVGSGKTTWACAKDSTNKDDAVFVDRDKVKGDYEFNGLDTATYVIIILT